MNFKSHISHLKFVLAALIGLALCSCQQNEPSSYSVTDLQGLWLQDNDNTEHYVRFTDEKSDEADYLYGREWNEYYGDEDQATYESDLIEAREKLGHPGNGWFKYKLETKGNLHEIHLMDNGGADIPKEYIVSTLTTEKLEYYEKDKPSWKYSFTKVVEKK